MEHRKIVRLLTCFTLCLLVVGCGSSNSDSTNTPSNDDTQDSMPSAETEGTGAIAGLWDFTETDEDGLDIVYALIGDDETLTRFDYAQDDVGNGENCYFILSVPLKALGDNQFQFLFDVVGIEKVDDNTLRVTIVDESDRDGDGDTTELVSDEFPALVGVDPIDLNQC